jgi:hypothetical protein
MKIVHPLEDISLEEKRAQLSQYARLIPKLAPVAQPTSVAAVMPPAVNTGMMGGGQMPGSMGMSGPATSSPMMMQPPPQPMGYYGGMQHPGSGANMMPPPGPNNMAGPPRMPMMAGGPRPMGGGMMQPMGAGGPMQQMMGPMGGGPMMPYGGGRY